jgi:hypothetical protein
MEFVVMGLNVTPRHGYCVHFSSLLNLPIGIYYSSGATMGQPPMQFRFRNWEVVFCIDVI